MKNIRGALFLLSLSIVILFNSTTIAQSKAPTIWVCSTTYSSDDPDYVKKLAKYTLIKFKSLNLLNKSLGSEYGSPEPRYSLEEKKEWEAKILHEKNCRYKIEKQSYKRLYGKIRNDFEIEKIYGEYGEAIFKIDINNQWPFEGQEEFLRFEYYERGIGRNTLAELSKKYNEYPLKNLASTTQTQQLAKKEKKKEKIKKVAKKKENILHRPISGLCSKSSEKIFYITFKKIWIKSPSELCEKGFFFDPPHVMSLESLIKNGYTEISESTIAKKEKKKEKIKKVAKKKAAKNILNYNCKYKTIDKKYPFRLKLENRTKVYFEDEKYTLFGAENDPSFYYGFTYFNHQALEIGHMKSDFHSKIKGKKITNSLISKYSFPAHAECKSADLEIAKKEPKKKEKKKVAKKTKKDWKCRVLKLCKPEKKTHQVAKKIINIYCVKNNYSSIRIAKGEKPNCKNSEFKVVKNEYLLLESVYDNLASYFDLNDSDEVVLFERRVRDIFKITHQDFNNLTETQQVAKIENTKKSSNLFKKKEEKKITIKEVLDLGKYTEFNAYPEGMLKEFKNCKKQFCRGKEAGKKVYEIFVRRGPLWHERHPGDMIYGMAWFEIMYLEKLRKNKKQIARYIKNGPKGYSSEIKMRQDVKALHSLIKTNKGRIKMREALGLNAKEDLAKVLRRHWLLGDFLNNDNYKVKKVRLNSDLKKRKKLLEKYQASLKKYKEKLEKDNKKKVN